MLMWKNGHLEINTFYWNNAGWLAFFERKWKGKAKRTLLDLSQPLKNKNEDHWEQFFPSGLSRKWKFKTFHSSRSSYHFLSTGGSRRFICAVTNAYSSMLARLCSLTAEDARLRGTTLTRRLHGNSFKSPLLVSAPPMGYTALLCSHPFNHFQGG